MVIVATGAEKDAKGEAGKTWTIDDPRNAVRSTDIVASTDTTAQVEAIRARHKATVAVMTRGELPGIAIPLRGHLIIDIGTRRADATKVTKGAIECPRAGTNM